MKNEEISTEQIGVSVGITKNLGNYESLRVDAWAKVNAKSDDKEAWAKVWADVEEQIEEKIGEADSALGGKS